MAETVSACGADRAVLRFGNSNSVQVTWTALTEYVICTCTEFLEGGAFRIEGRVTGLGPCLLRRGILLESLQRQGNQLNSLLLFALLPLLVCVIVSTI